MSRFTLTIDLPDDYDESAAAEFPNDVALEVLNGVFHDCEIEYASLLPTGHGRHRLDADLVDGERHRLEDVRQQGIVMLVAVDCIDMSDHYPQPRKRAWVIDESPPSKAAAADGTDDVEVVVVPSAGSDGAVVVMIDTPWEPDGSDGGPGLRVVVNDGHAWGQPYEPIAGTP